MKQICFEVSYLRNFYIFIIKLQLLFIIKLFFKEQMKQNQNIFVDDS